MARNRLEELRRQKELVQDHLAWLELEISHESCASDPSQRIAAPSKPTARVPVAHLLPDSPDRETERQAVVADEIYTSLGPEVAGSAQDARRGCLIFFAVAFSLLIAGVAWMFVS